MGANSRHRVDIVGLLLLFLVRGNSSKNDKD